MPVLAERMLLPVDVIVQPVSESTLEPVVFFQASVICHPAQQVSGQASAMQEKAL